MHQRDVLMGHHRSCWSCGCRAWKTRRVRRRGAAAAAPPPTRQHPRLLCTLESVNLAWTCHQTCVPCLVRETAIAVVRPGLLAVAEEMRDVRLFDAPGPEQRLPPPRAGAAWPVQLGSQRVRLQAEHHACCQRMSPHGTAGEGGTGGWLMGMWVSYPRVVRAGYAVRAGGSSGILACPAGLRERQPAASAQQGRRGAGVQLRRRLVPLSAGGRAAGRVQALA
jgi:hypothetical protein